MIGVSPEGILDSIGFLANGEVIREANNVLFKGYSFPFFEKIESLALKLHSRIDNLHIIGWDITLDANGKALLIEANATWPAISVPQLCCGPLFGERTQEIISYCKKNQHLLPNKVFNI